MKNQEGDVLPPTSVPSANGEVKAGDRVRLHPSASADTCDLLLAGKTAWVEDIKQDEENRLYVVVTLDDNPDTEQGVEQPLPGYRYSFFPEEIELLEGPPVKEDI